MTDELFDHVAGLAIHVRMKTAFEALRKRDPKLSELTPEDKLVFAQGAMMQELEALGKKLQETGASHGLNAIGMGFTKAMVQAIMAVCEDARAVHFFTINNACASLAQMLEDNRAEQKGG